MRPLIGILLETYPQASEKFVLNEILELERQGLHLHIFSLRASSEQPIHPSVDLVKAPVTYVPSLLPTFDRAKEKELIAAQLTLFQQDSSTYVETLKRYLKRDEEQRLNEFLQAGYLACQMQELGITHLHAHGADVSAATAEIAQAFSGISYSITVHAKDIDLGDNVTLAHHIAKSEFVFTGTDYSRHHLESISTSRTPIHVAYHGIDVGSFSPMPKSHQAKIPLILNAGDLCESEGISYLLKACHLLKQVEMSFRCVIVGDGPLRESIQQQINNLGLNEHITLVGKLTREQLIKYYQQADLFVLPRLSSYDNNCDGISNVLLEAMAMEIPVISTNILRVSEVVQPYCNGMLVPEKDVLSLAQALESLLRQPKFKRTLGKASRLTVLDKFGLSSNVKLIKDLLLKATQKKPLRFPTQISMHGELHERHSA